MANMDLKQIEADVVFIGTNEDAGTVHIQPMWECEVPAAELPAMAATFGLWAVEQDGCGSVRVEIHDFRNRA